MGKLILISQLQIVLRGLQPLAERVYMESQYGCTIGRLIYSRRSLFPKATMRKGPEETALHPLHKPHQGFRLCRHTQK